MHFLVVSHFFADHGGGIERVCDQLCRHLADAGHGVTWAASAGKCPTPRPHQTDLVLRCINPTEALTGLPMPIPGPSAIVRLWSATRDTDVVVIHDSLYCTSIVAMVVAKILRKPVILIQHVAEIPFASKVMRLAMALANQLVTRSMMRAADQVLFISATVQQYFAGYTMQRPALLQFNGVDAAVFHPGDATRPAFGLPVHGLLVAFAGRFVEKKGLAILHAVALRRPDVQFAMAGSGPIDPEHWGLANVHVLGALSPERIAALFRSADCLVLPSVGEGYPLVIQEAMAVGLRVVCGEESAFADPDAKRWLSGVDIDLRQIDASASAICNIIDRFAADQAQFAPDQRQAMIRYAQTRYGWPGFAARIAAVGRSISPRS